MISHPKIRQQKRQCRQQLSAKTQKKHSHLVLKKLKKQLSFQKSRHIVLYIANDGELDPDLITSFLKKRQKKCYLPVLHPFKKNELWFCEWNQHPLKRNKFNILEPNTHLNKKTQITCFDIIFIPLTAFDKKNNRLGMGAGYYDRSLAKINQFPALKPLFIGLAHHCQITEKLIPQPWDIPLDQIITDKS